MLQSGLVRLKSVFNGSNGDSTDKPRHQSCQTSFRSNSCIMRQDISRQILSKKMSVPVLPSHSSLHHNPLQLSRSVPCHNHSPTCPSNHYSRNSPQHRKLTRSGMISSGDMMKMRMRQRERAKSTSALTRIDHEREVKNAKRRKQDENRNIFTRDSDSSSESNPEDHIYEEIDSDVFVTSNDDEEPEPDNFLLSISLERQRNLKFYGSAGWDFGSVS